MIVASVAFALMQATAVLTGTVLTDSTESPIANAEVAIASLGFVTRSDAHGNFTIGKIPRGTYAVSARALGYSVLLTSLTFDVGKHIEIDLLLQIAGRPAQQLSRVDVRAKSISGNNPRIAEFDERMKFGIGTFITQPAFEKAEGRKLAEALIQRIPGMRTVRFGSGRALVSERGVITINGPPHCYMRVVVDGFPQNVDDGFDIDTIDPLVISAGEFYTVAQTPAQFNIAGNAACGTLVLWTRYRVR